ncbi:trichohyalin isoform X2 [Osmerus eperlanus]|uniref:trichohyalin isoform X2 n=1 Tax=Osmerus eperlanus TaxID=29151 RepID=UPI002E0EAB54
MERERERRREEKRWREQQMNRLKVRTGKRGKETDRTESYGEGDRAPGSRWRETEREQRERDGRGGERHPIGRPTSHYEFGVAREPETERGKGDTFPRMRTRSKDRGRGMSPFLEEEGAGDAGRPRERLREMEVNDKERDRERAARRGGQRGGERDQRYREERSRDKEREGVRVRAREEGEKNGGRPMEDGLLRQRERQRQSDSDVRERRRERDSEGNDLWSRGANAAGREGLNPHQREREGRYYSPQAGRERNGENHSDRDHRERRDKMRDIKSEGDSDTERMRENVRNDRREEQRHHQSRSEGDNGNVARDRLTETERERQRWREEERRMYSERGGGRDPGRHGDRGKYREGDRRERRDWGVERDLERRRDAGRERPSGRPEERRRQRDQTHMKDPEWERAQAHVPGERGKRRERGSYPDRKEDDDRMFRERRNRERDPTREGVADRISRSPSETVRGGAPRASSSGEWSSDMESDRRWRKDRERPGGKESEKESIAESERDGEEERRRRTRYKDTAQGDRPDKERDGEEEKMSTRSGQRKMWLEPQRGKHSNNSSVEEEFIERERKRRGEENRGLRSEDTSRTEREGRALVEGERRRRRENLGGDGGKAREVETEGLNVDREEEWEGRGVTVRGEEEPRRRGDDTRKERGHREGDGENDKHGSDGEEEGGSDRRTRSESEGGSEREEEEERERVHSLAEDGFITVSSGGDEEDEREEFQDCKEFWEGGAACDVPREEVGYKGCEGEMPLVGERERREEWTERAEVAAEGSGEERKEKRKEENPTYVFCVIGQTLPRSNRMSAQAQMEGEETNQNPGNEQHGTAGEMGDPAEDRLDKHNDSYQDVQNERREEGDDPHALNRERPWVGDGYRAPDPSKAEERGEGGGVEADLENPYAEITLRRDLTTEALLKEWRERSPACPRQTGSEREPSSHISSGPAAEAHRPGAPVSDEATLSGMSPDEQVALRIRMSGAWSLAEEAKRHSQAPHLKWAKNVVSEILGSPEDRDDPRAGSRAGGEEERKEDPAAEGGRASPVYSTVRKVGAPGRHSGAEPDQREAEEVRGMRPSQPDMHVDAHQAMHGETPTSTHADTFTNTEREEEGRSEALDARTDVRLDVQVEPVPVDEGQRAGDPVERGRDSQTEETKRDTDEELEYYLAVTNILYKPNSCPSLCCSSPELSIPTIKVEGDEEHAVRGGEGNRLGEESAVGDGESAGEEEEEEEEEERDKLVEGFQGRGEEENTVKNSFSFREFRRNGIRRTTVRRKDEIRGEEEEGGVGRDRRTKVFTVSDDNDAMHLSWGEADLRNATDTITRTRRRNSKFFNAQLYQQYSETVQNREIRQSRSDVLSTSEDLPVAPAPVPPRSPAPSPAPSPASSPTPARRPLPPLPMVPHPHSLSHSSSFSSTVSAKSLPLPLPPHADGRPSSPRLSISLTSSPTLWQDLPGVRDSAGLAEVTDDQRRLQEVRFEVITSEASYCRSLDIVVEHFVKSKQLGTLLTTQDRNWLFSRLADVRTISHRFLSKLEERVESDLIHFTVCDIIARHCQHFKMVYVPYLTNQSYQDATYQRLMEENAGFKRLVDKLERSSVCQRLPLRSFLILPFQRITRIKLLVQNIVKRIAPGTEEELHAIRAMKLLGKLIQESNDSITQMKSIESLVSLSAKVDFECRTLPLVSQSRRLVREGPATELMDFSLKETERSVYLHLFNDYLLLSLHKEGGRFTVIDHAPVSELRVENCRVKLHSLQKNIFRLHMSSKSLLLRSDTQSNKLRWISALSRPHPVIDFSAAQDFTQMQCIRAFVAQQPDGLSLEKADVILVHQQSSDGWVEGTRLSDRQRGWAPESHLETITSPRAQQRNLLDALKITTATAAV